jgi:hypothetical protein
MDDSFLLIQIVLSSIFILYVIRSSSIYRKMSERIELLKMELAKANFRVYVLEKKQKVLTEEISK